MKYRHFLIALGLLFCFFQGESRADYIVPGGISVRTVDYQPGPRNFHDGVYSYAISWQGIPVAKSSISVSRARDVQPPLIKVDVFASTLKGIDWLYRLRHQTTSLFHEDTFHPVSLTVRQTENSKVRVREVNFQDDGTVVSRLWKGGKKDSETSFSPTNQMFDPVSAAFLARTLPIEAGKQFSFDVFNGRHRYLITFDVKNRETIESEGKMRKAFRIIPTVKKLTDSQGEKRFKGAVIWISDDEQREILRLESKVWIGKVSAI